MAKAKLPPLYIDEFDHNADWPKRSKDTLRALLGKSDKPLEPPSDQDQTLIEDVRGALVGEARARLAERITGVILEAAGVKGERWITLDSGAHVQIDGDGNIQQGFGKGQNIKDLPDKNVRRPGKSQGKQPTPKDPEKAGAAQAGKEHERQTKGHHPAVQRIISEPSTPPPPGAYYRVDPAADTNGDGVTDASRVGVPGGAVPTSVPELPRLTKKERQVERSFRKRFEADPQGMAEKYQEKLRKRELGDGPNVFGTDDAKMLCPQYARSVEDRALYNTALHQTANAIAKRSFLDYLDKHVVTQPEEYRTVLVTAGGCGSGKGYAIGNTRVKDIAAEASAVWDSAGEQNSTEMQWVADQCAKRGIKATFVYVHADPFKVWDDPKGGVIERAGKKGRMVDARLYADSYAHGAQNFASFAAKNQGQAEFVYIDSSDRTQPPRIVPEMPKSAIDIEAEKLYKHALDRLYASNAPAHVKRGGSTGARIWGTPRVAAEAIAQAIQNFLAEAAPALGSAEWEEEEHPRAADGKFTNKAGGGTEKVTDANYKESDPLQKLLPGVLDALGVPETQLKLEGRARKAVRECETVMVDAEGEEIDTFETYQDLDEDQQMAVMTKWLDEHVHDYEEEPLNAWREELYRDCQSEIENDQDFAVEFVKDKLRDLGIDPEAVDAGVITVETAYPAPRIVWDDEREDEIRWLNPDEHEGESALDAVADIREDKEWADFEEKVNDAAQDLAESREQEGPPDGVQEEAYDAATEAWGRLSEEDRTREADDQGYLEKTFTVEAPDEWQPYSDGEDYQKTKYCARYLQAELSRKTLGDLGVDLEQHGERADKLASRLWGSWKGSSTSDEGLLLQYVTAEVLSGERQSWPAETMAKIDTAAKSLDQWFGGSGDVERGKKIAEASVHATWAAGQYVLQNANLEHVELYRAVLLPGEMLANEKTEAVSVDLKLPGMSDTKYERLPNLTLKKNGAASATTKESVANSWGGVGDLPENPVRVVLRIRAPREAAISLPCFGQNYTHEEEVVVAGTHWDQVEAWKDKAPRFNELPM